MADREHLLKALSIARVALRRIAGPDGYRNNNEYDAMNIAAKALADMDAEQETSRG